MPCDTTFTGSQELITCGWYSMGLIRWIKETFGKMFLRKEAKDVFGIDLSANSKMDALINQWYNITSGNPPWIDADDDIESINFAQYIDDVTSGLVTLDIEVNLPDSARGKELQKVADYLMEKIDEKVSDALGSAGIMFKPNGEKLDYYYPGSFIPTDWDSNGNILGCIFVNRKYAEKKIYTKFEYHRYENFKERKLYAISNRAFKSTSENSKGDPCKLTEVSEWAELMPDAYIENVDIPLFSYYGNPKPNFLEKGSALKLPIWEICKKELRDLDIAWSRKSAEIEDSKHITFIPQQAIMYAEQHNIKLPRFLKGLQMNAGTTEGKVDEHVATLLTEQRIKDINSILAMISTKLGYDQGFFVLDEKTGMMTATQVEADDQSTIRTIKNLRDPLRDAIVKLLYGANVFIDIYHEEIPAEAWGNSYEEMKEALKDSFSFGDITYSYEEDKQSWWKYRIQGDVPPWMYYVKFEGMSEEEAKEMVQQAQPKEPTLFGNEE